VLLSAVELKKDFFPFGTLKHLWKTQYDLKPCMLKVLHFYFSDVLFYSFTIAVSSQTLQDERLTKRCSSFYPISSWHMFSCFILDIHLE